MFFAKKLLYYQNMYPRLYTSPTVAQLVLAPGTYRLTLRGAGGAGGENGGNQSSQAPYGAGGAGGKGLITSTTITVTNATIAEIHVGEGGKSGELGNGGATGSGLHPAGYGGGGGMPSYIMFSSQSNTRQFYGWQAQLQYGGTYNEPTTTYYVNYDENDPTVPVTITTTSGAQTMDSFTLVHGTTYMPNHHFIDAGDDGGVTIWLSMNNRGAEFQGNTTGLDGRTVTPLDVSSYFVGNLLYTTSALPSDNDGVFAENTNNHTFNAVGTVTNFSDIGRDHFTASQDSVIYYRYEEFDTEEQTQSFSNLYYALGGGGGGGGGGWGEYGRLRHAGAGAGGGGYYRIDSITGVITSVPGQAGGNSGGNDDGRGGDGRTGNTTDFPNIMSGRGGRGGYSEEARGRGGEAAYGGGASGGGGGGGAGNHSTSSGGGGGGGAGGCEDAGGGMFGWGSQKWVLATSGSNHHTEPTDTTDENAEYGVVGNYGTGGEPGTNGTNGFILIERI